MRLWTSKCFRKSSILTGISLLVLGGFASSCEDNNKVSEPLNPVPESHRDYIELEAGMTLTYRLDSIIYDNFTRTIDTTRYQVTHRVQEQTLDSAEMQEYLLKRTVRTIDEGEVLESALYQARKTSEEYQVFRNNQRTLALEFPLSDGHEWNGNAYNTQDSQIYRVKAIHEPATILNKRYDSTLLVQEEDQQNLIKRNASKTRYAKQIGPVFRERINLSFKGDSIPPEEAPWEAKANTGNIVRYRLQTVTKGQ
jgi:hypothetical protein